MISVLRSSVHRSWILLVLATCATYGLRIEDIFGFGAAVATMGIAYFKGRLVVLNFMELRNAGALRIVLEVLLFVIFVSIIGTYWYSEGR